MPDDRVVQLAAEPGVVDDVLAHPRLEPGPGRLAGVLGRVHRDVGVAQHLVGAVAGAGERDADAGVREQLVLADPERHRERGQDARGGLLGLGRVVVVEQHRELVAAQPGRQVG